MAAATAPVKGYPPTFLCSSTTSPRTAISFRARRFPRNHPLQQRGSVFPSSVAWTADGGRRLLKAQEPVRMLPRCNALHGREEFFFDCDTPTSYLDVFLTRRERPSYLDDFRILRPLPPPSGQLEAELMCEEYEQPDEALEQCGRNFVDGIIQYVSSEKGYYKFIIIACKEKANMIMELGFIACCDRDNILNGLERIEEDIAKGRFEWRENKDVRSNIVEALVERVGEPAGMLDATICQYVQKLTILRLWLHDSVDKMVTQIEQLQVELVLLALRNWGFVLPRLFERNDWILLDELILSKVDLLEREVLQLHCCKNKIDTMLRITFPVGSTDGYPDRLSDDATRLLQNAVINFANMVIGNVAIDISTLEREIRYWICFQFLTPNDKVRESFSLLEKHVSDLRSLATTDNNYLTRYHSDIKDPCKRFLTIYVIVQQVLEAATDFARNASFNHEKVQSSESIRYIETRGSSYICTEKVREKDQNEKEKDDCAMAMRDFRSRSDEAMKRLIDWLGKHQTRESPLKFCQWSYHVADVADKQEKS